jgi:hypothetical protein
VYYDFKFVTNAFLGTFATFSADLLHWNLTGTVMSGIMDIMESGFDAGRPWVDQVIEFLDVNPACILPNPGIPKAVLKAKLDLLRRKVTEQGLNIGVRIAGSNIHAWNLQPGEPLPARQLAAQSHPGVIRKAEPPEPHTRVIFDIENRLIEGLDKRRSLLGLRSRNEAVKCALELYLNSEPVVTLEAPCSGCAHAGKAEGAEHCGAAGREIGLEVDKEWNRTCPRGMQRVIRTVCGCTACPSV